MSRLSSYGLPYHHHDRNDGRGPRGDETSNFPAQLLHRCNTRNGYLWMVKRCELKGGVDERVDAKTRELKAHSETHPECEGAKCERRANSGAHARERPVSMFKNAKKDSVCDLWSRWTNSRALVSLHGARGRRLRCYNCYC